MTAGIRETTIRQFVDAIRQNGVPQMFGALAREEYGRITAACAVGQAGINLFDNAYAFEPFDYTTIIYLAIDLNDGDRLSFEEIANTIEENYRDKLDDLLIPLEGLDLI